MYGNFLQLRVQLRAFILYSKKLLLSKKEEEEEKTKLEKIFTTKSNTLHSGVSTKPRIIKSKSDQIETTLS